MCWSAAVFSSSRMRPRATWRPRLASMISTDWASTASLTSASTTSSPASAQTWVMPRPICPAPTTPMRFSSIISAHRHCERSEAISRKMRIPVAIAAARRARLAMPMRSSGSLLALGELGIELGKNLEQVADQPVIGDLEDRRLLVLVDGDDHLRILHTRQMLDRAGDADGDVKLRRNDLAGLADLIVIRHKPGIDRGAGCADRRAEPVGDRFQQVEIVARLHSAPAGDDDAGAGELRPLGFRQLGLHELRQAGRAGSGDRLDRGRAAFPLDWWEGGAAHRDDLDAVL